MHHHVLYIKDTIKTRLVVVDLHAQRLRPNQLSDNKISPWDTRQTTTRLHSAHFHINFIFLYFYIHPNPPFSCLIFYGGLSWFGCLNPTTCSCFVGFAVFLRLKIYRLFYFWFGQEIYWLASPANATAMHSMRLLGECHISEENLGQKIKDF